MKRFLLEISLFITLQAVVAVGWQAYRSCYDDSYLAAVADKERLLAAAPGPRIVFVGGSNLAFGLDSEMVERRLQRHPVNMGVYAAFGLPFMLREAQASLRPGDVVVLVPEYEHFLRAELSGQDMPPEQWAVVAWLSPGSLRFAPEEALRELFLTARGARALVKVGRQRDDPTADNIYRRHNFNRHGDLVVPPQDADAVFSYPPGGPGPLVPNRETTEAMSQCVRGFVDWCRRNGVRFFWAWPPVPTEKYRTNAGALDEIEAVVGQTVPTEVLIRVREAVLPLNRFLNTEYHLNRAGRRERTDLLCRRLADALRPAAEARSGRRP